MIKSAQLASATAAVGTILLVVGCSPAGPDTSAPESSATPTGAQPCSEVGELGAAAARDAVTDDFGTYCGLTAGADARDGYMTIDDSPSASIIRDAGFTDADVEAMQDTAYRIAVEHSLDGALLDSDVQTVAEWYHGVGSDLVMPAAQHFYEELLESNAEASLALVITDLVEGNLARDGQPRSQNLKITTTDLDLIEYEGQYYLRVGFAYSADLRASQGTVRATLEKLASDESQSAPDDAPLRLEAEQKMTFGRNDLTRIVGGQLEYRLLSSTGAVLKIMEDE